MIRILVIIRELPNRVSTIPVTSEILAIPEGEGSEKSFCEKEFEAHKKKFIEQFAEFSAAKWRYDVMTLHSVQHER